MKTPILFGLTLATAWAQPVAKILDGDTLELTDGARVRLHCIDAPELNQAGGAESRGFLSALVFQQGVRFEKKGTDRYGRMLAEAFVADVNLNVRLVEAGQAWRYVEYCQDQRYATAQASAEANRAGLWAGSEKPVAPWEFRHGGQQQQASSVAEAAPAPAEEAAPQSAKPAAGGQPKLYRGPKGGCYYITPSGSKRYVSRSMCN